MSAPQLTPHLPAEGHVPGDTTRGGALATAGWGQPGEGHPEAGGGLRRHGGAGTVQGLSRTGPMCSSNTLPFVSQVVGAAGGKLFSSFFCDMVVNIFI